MIAVIAGAFLVVMGLLGLFGPWSRLRDPDAKKTELRIGFGLAIAFGLFIMVSFL